MTKYIILDESSAMHIPFTTEPYFIIGGYITDNYLWIRKKCTKIENKLRSKNSYIAKKERNKRK